MGKINILFKCLLVLSFFVVSCTPNKSEFINNDNLYVVDLDELGAYGHLVKASSIFKKSETIILETGKDCLVGSNFSFFAFDNYLFILNRQPSKDFLIFNREGKFIRKIGGLGSGPGEYTQVFDFTLDTVNRVIYMLCDMVINKYQLDGTPVGSIRLGSQAAQIQYAHGKLYTELRGGKYMLQEIDPETGEITGSYLETAQHNKGWNETHFVFGDRPLKRCWVESPKFAHTFMDTVFSIQPDGVMPFLAIKSKHLTTRADVEATEGMAPEDRIAAIRDKDKIFGICHYFDTKKHIFFGCTHGESILTVFYDRETNSCRKGVIFNDFTFVESNRMMLPLVIFSDSNGIYEGVYAHNWEFLLEEYIAKDKLTPYADKRDELMKLNEDSNPVIFYYSYGDAE